MRCAVVLSSYRDGEMEAVRIWMPTHWGVNRQPWTCAHSRCPLPMHWKAEKQCPEESRCLMLREESEQQSPAGGASKAGSGGGKQLAMIDMLEWKQSEHHGEWALSGATRLAKVRIWGPETWISSSKYSLLLQESWAQVPVLIFAAQPPITPAPGELAPFLGSVGTHTEAVDNHTADRRTHMHTDISL